VEAELANGRPEVAPADSSLRMDLTVAEAQHLRNWLLKPAADGSSTMDDDVLKPVMEKLCHELDYREGVASVRHELEQAGLATARLTDEQVATLGSKISEHKLRRATAQA
jgi:hypothetical protein